MNRPPHSPKGVTLLELVAVMTVLTITLYMAVPRMNLKPNLSRDVMSVKKDPFCAMRESIGFYPLPWNAFSSMAKENTQSALCTYGNHYRARVAVCYKLDRYDMVPCQIAVKTLIQDCQSMTMKQFGENRYLRVSAEDQKREMASLLTCVGAGFSNRYKAKLYSKNKVCSAIDNYLNTGQPDQLQAACVEGIPWQ